MTLDLNLHPIISRVKYLKEEVKNTSLALQAHKDEWDNTGCTIMTDGWTGKKRRTINFLENIPKGNRYFEDHRCICNIQNSLKGF